jgi:integrase
VISLRKGALPHTLPHRNGRPRRIQVRRAIKTGNKIGAPKSRAGTRAVPLAASLARDLLELRLEQGADDEDWCFPDANGNPRDLRNFSARVIAPAAQAAGVPWATGHTLRHSFASRAIRQGCNVKQLQVMMGHAKVAQTLDTYAHLMADDLPSAMSEIVPAEPVVDAVVLEG